MLTEMQDRDAIVSNAIEIASTAVRQAYIAGACGSDSALRRQVEERVAAHLAAASPGPRPAQREPAHSSANHNGAGEVPAAHSPDRQPDLDKVSMEVRKMGQEKPRGLMTVWALLLLLPASVAGAGFTMWKMHSDDPKQKSAQQLQEERDQALKAEEEANKQLEKEVATRKAAEKERDEALAGEKAARRSEEENKAVLAFLQDKLLLSTGNKESWSGDGLGKKATLRQAVDAAEAKVTGAFVDKPLVEASIRQILGATYLELGESTRAIHQYEQALALREGELGRDHPDTGECRKQLAVAYRRANRPDDASRLFDPTAPDKKRPNLKSKQNPARTQGSNAQDARTLAQDSE